MEAIVEGPERRERITAEIMERTGIDEAMIERLVRGFYANGRAGLRPASNSASPAPTASCSATGNDFDATRQEQSNGRSCTCRHEQGAGRSVFRQQPGADARHRVGADLCRDDRGAGLELRLTSVIPGRCEASNPNVQLHIVESRDSPVRNCAPEVWCLRTIPE